MGLTFSAFAVLVRLDILYRRAPGVQGLDPTHPWISRTLSIVLYTAVLKTCLLDDYTWKSFIKHLMISLFLGHVLDLSELFPHMKTENIVGLF